MSIYPVILFVISLILLPFVIYGIVILAWVVMFVVGALVPDDDADVLNHYTDNPWNED